MNSVSSFIFLLSLIANCHLAPLTEFDIDFQDIEKSYQHCPMSCQELNSSPSTAKSQESECQCFTLDCSENCTYKVIENGLRKLNQVCNISDKQTHKTCRILERVKNFVTTNQTLCGTKVSPRSILNHIRFVHQLSNSMSS